MPATALVIGASRGIGLEFARQYRAAGWCVIGTVRNDAGAARLAALGATPVTLDVTAPDAPRKLALALGTAPLELAIHVAGIIDRTRASEAPARDAFDALFRTNVFGAMQLIPTVAPLVVAAGGTFAFMSSGMSLIAGVPASDSWLYRASKAALNMAVAAARHDYPHATFVLLDPGWVRTDMGGAGAPLAVEDSVVQLRAVLAKVTPADSGHFFHRDGRRSTHW